MGKWDILKMYMDMKDNLPELVDDEPAKPMNKNSKWEQRVAQEGIWSVYMGGLGWWLMVVSILLVAGVWWLFSGFHIWGAGALLLVYLIMKKKDMPLKYPLRTIAIIGGAIIILVFIINKVPIASKPTATSIAKVPTATYYPNIEALMKRVGPGADSSTEDIIPSGYYNSPCLIPKGVSLNSYLTDYHWVVPYQAGGWDCSQMAAWVEWALDNCGYETNIVITTPSAEIDHAWVEIMIGGKWRQYETTGESFYFQPVVLRAIYAGNTKTFKDIYEVYEYSVSERSFITEWAWWEE